MHNALNISYRNLQHFTLHGNVHVAGAQMCFFCIAHICVYFKRNLHKCYMVGGTFCCIVFNTKNLYKVQFARGAYLCSGFICIALCSKMRNMQGGRVCIEVLSHCIGICTLCNMGVGRVGWWGSCGARSRQEANAPLYLKTSQNH